MIHQGNGAVVTLILPRAALREEKKLVIRYMQVIFYLVTPVAKSQDRVSVKVRSDNSLQVRQLSL